jgi:hypothetical protein
MITPKDSNIVEKITIDDKNIYFLKEGETFSQYLNDSKDKLTFEINLPKEKRYIYSVSFTFEELSKISPFFNIEENLENINQLISESINNYGITIMDGGEEEKNNKFVVIKFAINSKIKEIKFTLNKGEISEEQFISSLYEKINYFINERKKVYGIKSFQQINQEKNEKKNEITKKLEELNERLDKMGKSFINLNVISLQLNSHIINEPEDIQFISKYLKTIELGDAKNKKAFIEDIILYKLVYRASRDGDSAREFHKRCDDIGPNIVFIKTDDNLIFGGFTMNNWGNIKGQKETIKEDPESFCFSLALEKDDENDEKEKDEKKEKIRNIYQHKDEEDKAIFCRKDYGPTFCNNIFCVYDNMLSDGGYCDKNKDSCFEGQEEDYEISGGNKKFKIKELEVFEIIH